MQSLASGRQFFKFRQNRLPFWNAVFLALIPLPLLAAAPPRAAERVAVTLLGCDELTVPLELRSGENRLVVKLQRFWERRWMFCARLSDGLK